MKYKNCKLFLCISPDEIFNKDELYPVYNINGYYYVMIWDETKHKPELYFLDAYTDGSFESVEGTAEFKEVNVQWQSPKN